MNKINFLFLIVFMSPAIVFGQFSANANVGFMHFTGGTGLKHFGAGIRGEYTSTEIIGAYGGFGFFLPENYQADVRVYATGSEEPYELDIPTDSRVSFRDVYIGGKVYFIGLYEADASKPWGVYALVEGGLLFGKSITNLPLYDEEKYWSPIQDEVEGTFVNYIAGFGVGTEYLMGKTYLFLDVKCRATIDEANKQLVRTYVPLGLNYNIGFRYPFDFSF